MAIEYYIHLAILILIYALLAQSFNLTFGVGRLFNLAHGACFALGAYATALWSTEMGDISIAFWRDILAWFGLSSGANTLFFCFCLFLSVVTSTLLAFLLGAISLRLANDYFAIGTLAFSAVISALLTNWKSLTRGVLGIPGIARPQVLGISMQENADFLRVLAVVFVIVQFVFYILFRNTYTRRLRAQAEFEAAAMSLGIHAEQVRLWSFAAAAAGAGIAGAFFAFYLQYIDPSSFSFLEMIFVLTIVVVGRPGSFWGCIGAAAFLLLLPEFLSRIEWINNRPSILGPMRQLLYALLLFLVVLMNKKRLFPTPREV